MRRHAAASLVCVLALVVGGCSSGGDDEPATVAARASSGCDAASPIPPGEEHVTIASDGVDRMYIRHVPPGAGATPMPVILDLHGYSEGADIHTRFSNLGAYGDTEGFITLTPNGQGQPVRWITQVDSADVAFLGAVLDEAERTLCIDRNREYVAGMSNGAMMTSVLACVMADRIAAVAPVAGAFAVAGCDPARPVPVIAFHGTADEFVKYTGGYGTGAANLPAPDGSGRRLADVPGFDNVRTPSIPTILRRWAKRNGCGLDATTTSVASDVALIAYPCPTDSDVELYRVDGGGHAWPGSEISKLAERLIGPTTTSISANKLLWAFFDAHPLTSD